MAIRYGKPTNINWERDRLFVSSRRINGCRICVKYNTDELRGMLAIKVGFLMSTLNALYALLGE